MAGNRNPGLKKRVTNGPEKTGWGAPSGPSPSLSSAEIALETELRMRGQHQALVVEVGALLAEALDAERNLGQVAARLCERAQLAAASIYLTDHEKRQLRCVAKGGETESEGEAEVIPLDASENVPSVARKGEALYTHGAPRDESPPGADLAYVAEYVVPLRVGTKILGGLRVASKRPEGIHATLRKMVDQVAAQIALAIEHSILAKRLRANEGLFRSLFEQLDLGVALCDREGHFLKGNPVFGRLLGYETVHLCDLHLLDIIHPDERHSFHQWMDQVMAGQVNQSTREFRCLKESGEPLCCLMTLTVIRDEAGSHTYTVVLLHDFGERKQAEEARSRRQEQFLHAQKMEAMGRLAGGIAHDFNNLLGVILGFTSLAQLRIRPGDPLHETLRVIGQTATRAAGLTRRLLRFARQERGEFRPLSVETLLNRTVTIVTETFDRKIAVETRLLATPAWVRGEEGQLEQALLNLCLNARDAMPEGGTLTLDVSRVNLGFHDPLRPAHCAPGDYVRICVKDTGAGIEPEVLEHIFDPFFTTKDPGQGTGLGLAMVCLTADIHGGFLRATSEVSKGSGFCLYLPALQAPEEALAEKVSGPLERGTGTVLIVDDEPMFRVFTEKALQMLGYRVLSAEDGGQACEIFEAQGKEIGCVLLDLVMPGLSWLETYRRLREINPQVRIILSSGYLNPREAQEGLAVEPLEFLGKPYSVETLARVISGQPPAGEDQETPVPCES